MDHFARKLITEWRKLELPFDGVKILLAVSGGADSCALAFGLRALVRQKKTTNDFIVAHFNHKLRGEEAEADARFVEEFAHQLDFDFVEGLPQEVLPKRNVEEGARKARYKFLTETAIKFGCRFILTGHTKNDQAETFLLNLIRGSGIEGLSGMETVRRVGEDEFFTGPIGSERRMPLLVRPMLGWAFREDTEKYVAEHKVSACVDSMNDDAKFDRVKVRKSLLPLLEEFNPRVVETLSRTAGILRDDAKVLAEFEKEERVETKLGFPVVDILEFAPARARRALRKWLGEQRGSLRRLDHKHIDALYSLAKSRKSGREIELPEGQSVIKRNGLLLFEKLKVEK